ncbi:MAG TPA: AMP-binding protein [Nocardioidaceae bacterium]|nr:AMP-binding protein [Nocardioidaceae bacterium]
MLPVRESTARISVMAKGLWTLAQTRIIRPYRPDRVYRMARTLARWGTGPAGGYGALADRIPHTVGLIDELGSLTFGEIHRQSNAIGRGLHDLGVREGDGVAVMCRNHRWFVAATVGIAKLGADVFYLNTAFSGPQLGDVIQRERPRVVIHDEEFGPLLDGIGGERLVAWHDEPTASGTSLADLVEHTDDADLPVPEREARTVILTSGTTGAPKGASRGSGSFEAAAALVSRLPLRYGWKVHVAAPMFHTWGWAHLNLSMLIGSTLVLRRRFDPAGFLAAVSEERCDAAIVIPVMLQRVLDLPESTRRRYDLSSLQVVAASGSALPGDLSTRWMDAFGDNLYNVYGSTECAWATIASPADMRLAPGTAGRPPLGTRVELFDDSGRPVSGGVGRIFVDNGALFEGYSGGGSKETVDGLMATGDVGRIDDGLLFVEGRDDDMIVSGGENVYPREIEDCLARHDDIADVAAIGVADADFGQRLRAFVVRREGAEVTEDDVRDYVKAQLARYKVPRDVWFCAELPRNATGKILKRELATWDAPPQ